MKIIIETIEHKDQRYDTCGDWQWNDEMDVLTIKVSQTNLYDHETILLIGVHELIEALLCRRSFTAEAEVDRFDLNWHPHNGLTEPGDDPDAPYHSEHLFASNIERLIAARLGINWQQYEREIERLA